MSSSIAIANGVVTITPDIANGAVVAIAYDGKGRINVNLDGIDHFFALGSVGLITLQGALSTGPCMFMNETGLETTVHGGSGNNVFTSGTAIDIFYGGSGINLFNAGPAYNMLIGGLGSNTFNESATGSGLIIQRGTSNSLVVPPNQTGSYTVISE